MNNQKQAPDYEGSIKWAHTELDTWGAPKEEAGLALTVSGRIRALCAENQTELTRLRAIEQSAREFIAVQDGELLELVQAMERLEKSLEAHK